MDIVEGRTELLIEFMQKTIEQKDEQIRELRETIENLAKNIASKVKKTRKPAYLEPMNPYERRIIHSTLQNDKYVDTYSEGDEPFRKVVVTVSKEYADMPRKYNNYRKKNYNNNNRRKSYNKNYNRGNGRNHSYTENED